MSAVEAMRIACGVLVAMLSEKSWVPPRSIDAW
jgi:hypothetical protein